MVVDMKVAGFKILISISFVVVAVCMFDSLCVRARYLTTPGAQYIAPTGRINK
jgi:hypothetical protein